MLLLVYLLIIVTIATKLLYACCCWGLIAVPQFRGPILQRMYVKSDCVWWHRLISEAPSNLSRKNVIFSWLNEGSNRWMLCLQTDRWEAEVQTECPVMEACDTSSLSQPPTLPLMLPGTTSHLTAVKVFVILILITDSCDKGVLAPSLFCISCSCAAVSQQHRPAAGVSGYMLAFVSTLRPLLALIPCTNSKFASVRLHLRPCEPPPNVTSTSLHCALYLTWQLGALCAVIHFWANPVRIHFSDLL